MKKKGGKKHILVKLGATGKHMHPLITDRKQSLLFFKDSEAKNGKSMW